MTNEFLKLDKELCNIVNKEGYKPLTLLICQGFVVEEKESLLQFIRTLGRETNFTNFQDENQIQKYNAMVMDEKQNSDVRGRFTRGFKKDHSFKNNFLLKHPTKLDYQTLIKT